MHNRKSNFIILTFAATLQSFGHSRIGTVIKSAPYPLKSTIAGLIASAFGWSRDDRRIEELANSFRYGVRIDKHGRVNFDLQMADTVGCRFKVDGKTLEDRKYLQDKEYVSDAIYTVFLDFQSEETANKVLEALQNPANILYLGRKCCLPKQPILQHAQIYDFDNMEKAMAKYPINEYGRIPESGFFECYTETIDGAIVTYASPHFELSKTYDIVCMDKHYLSCKQEKGDL